MNNIKRLEKKHGTLKRRRMEDLTTKERIWHYYFDLEFDIILTDAEEQTRNILQMTYELILKYYPGYSMHRIANFIAKRLLDSMSLTRTQRQCLNYINDALQIFGDPVDVSKEMKKQIYINRLHYLSSKAEKELDYNAAIKAIEKAAELEKFNQETDEMIKSLMADKEVKEIHFAATKEQLESIIQERRKKYLEDNSETTEILEDE